MVSLLLESWPFIAVVAVLAVAGLILNRRGARPNEPLYVRRDSLLDQREQTWFQKLRLAVAGKQYVLAKVRLGDLVSLGAPDQLDDAEIHRIDTAHVDFVICQPRSLRPRLAICLLDQATDLYDEPDDDEDPPDEPQGEVEFVGHVLDAAGIAHMEIDVEAETDVPRLRRLIRRGMAHSSK